MLRSQALEKLRDERLSAEGAALFAVLAPTRHQRAVVRLTVAFEVLFDLLDALGELQVIDRLGNNLELHRALLAAVDPAAVRGDFLRLHPQHDDGGYVDALVRRCQTALARLPSAAVVRPVALRAAERSRCGQSILHACAGRSVMPLLDWSLREASGNRSDFVVSEYAAGAISPLALHALFAAAADPATTAAAARSIDAAYYPAVCALTILFDSLIDAPRDRGTDTHSFLSHYPTAVHARERLVQVARCAQVAVRGLPHERRHGLLVAGIVAFYLSAPTARMELGPVYARRVLANVHQLTRPMLGALRLRRGSDA